MPSRILNGDQSAEEELVAQFGRGIYLIILARVRRIQVADALAQETLVSVLQALREGKLRQQDRLPAYVAGTARNMAKAYLRTKQRRERLAPHGPAGEERNPELDSQRSEQLRFAHECLAKLSLDDREILLLSLVEELDPAEIAKRLKIKPDAVRQRKFRAMRRARQTLGKLSQDAS